MLNSASCHILSDQRVSMVSIDRIWEEGRAGPQTVAHVWLCCATQMKYANIEQLIHAIGEAHDEVIHEERRNVTFSHNRRSSLSFAWLLLIVGAQKWRLVGYIADNASNLFHGKLC
jgi:hypothetical protein